MIFTKIKIYVGGALLLLLLLLSFFLFRHQKIPFKEFTLNTSDEVAAQFSSNRSGNILIKGKGFLRANTIPIPQIVNFKTHGDSDADNPKRKTIEVSAKNSVFQYFPLKKALFISMPEDYFYVNNFVTTRFAAGLELSSTYIDYAVLNWNRQEPLIYLISPDPKEALLASYSKSVAILRTTHEGNFDIVYKNDNLNSDVIYTFLSNLKTALTDSKSTNSTVNIESLINLTGYFQWLALNRILKNCDSTDELFISLEIGSNGLKMAHFMGWDYEEIFCTKSRISMLDKEKILLLGGANYINKAIVSNPKLFDLYKRVLEQTIFDHFSPKQIDSQIQYTQERLIQYINQYSQNILRGVSPESILKHIENIRQNIKKEVKIILEAIWRSAQVFDEAVASIDQESEFFKPATLNIESSLSPKDFFNSLHDKNFHPITIKIDDVPVRYLARLSHGDTRKQFMVGLQTWLPIYLKALPKQNLPKFLKTIRIKPFGNTSYRDDNPIFAIAASRFFQKNGISTPRYKIVKTFFNNKFVFLSVIKSLDEGGSFSTEYTLPHSAYSETEGREDVDSQTRYYGQLFDSLKENLVPAILIGDDDGLIDINNFETRIDNRGSIHFNTNDLDYAFSACNIFSLGKIQNQHPFYKFLMEPKLFEEVHSWKILKNLYLGKRNLPFWTNQMKALLNESRQQLATLCGEQDVLNKHPQLCRSNDSNSFQFTFDRNLKCSTDILDLLMKNLLFASLKI